ncbi:hypothetical protein A0J61_04768 [Choanephora cucurbitarum]|uniref:Distal membrane-arm assembly complex protein 1-like domain-containing protein n=1 Tax=Choanephora cucurbitarum TaxID=101091 RepID=A0A1C7NF48_9FUNG|nr:hypothetical protein A0J61_04768 [Choanephora cucurbitarum]
MINKIHSTLTQDNSNNELKQAAVYQDCLPCKVTGALGFGGLGAYALKEANTLSKMPGKSRTAVSLGVAGVVFISAGLYRLVL